MAESPQRNPSAEPVRLPDLFLKAVKAAIIGTDLSGIVNFWNPFAEELYGWSSEEVVGRNIMEITVSSETEEEARKYMASVLAGNSWAGEFQVRCKDAGFVSAFVTLALVKDDDGAAVGVVGVSQDIAGLKEAEGALRQSEEQFRAFANSLPGLCWIANSDGQVIWRNERWYEYTGTTPEQMEGQGAWSVHDVKMLPAVLERWKSSIEGGTAFEMEFPLRGADGVYRWFLTRIRPVRDEAGKITRWYGTATNIDEQRQLLKSLSEARDDLEKRVEERTAELRTATESLRDLSARLLRMRDDEQRRLARELHDSVGQLLAAIGMNIAVVMSEAARLTPEAAKCVAENAGLVDEVSREIRTISHLLHPPLLDEAGLASALRWYAEGFAKRSRIEVELEIPRDLRRLPNDTEITMFRVVQECLTNIHRHSGSATATIRINPQGDRIVVEVQDRGKGIPAEKLQRLTKVGQVGVGFNGMRERLRQLGGTLEIRSEENGTLVRAILPIEHSESEAHRGKRKSSQA
ncbi:MAG: PAS domain S-box protein [Candidatus Sulfotelmatobacter sp.]|jgi:PAS domain S-box-containing protein